MIDLLEQAFVDRLRTELPEFKVAGFPDDPEAYPFKNAKRELLVAYDGSTYGNATSLAPITQDRDARVTITILTRSLRGSGGVVTTVLRIIKALLGWRVARRVVSGDPPAESMQLLGGRPVQLVSDRHVGLKDGVWRWDVTFRVGGIVVGEMADLSGPQLKSVVVNRAEGGCE